MGESKYKREKRRAERQGGKKRSIIFAWQAKCIQKTNRTILSAHKIGKIRFLRGCKWLCSNMNDSAKQDGASPSPSAPQVLLIPLWWWGVERNKVIIRCHDINPYFTRLSRIKSQKVINIYCIEFMSSFLPQYKILRASGYSIVWNVSKKNCCKKKLLDDALWKVCLFYEIPPIFLW